MGGFSSEFDISIKSGMVAFNNISTEKYNTYKVVISKKEWFVDFKNQKIPIDKNDFSFVYNGNKISFDIVYNAIHGSPGEDGKMSAYLSMLSIPHNTCDHFESALAFNKRECISVVRQYGVIAAKSVFLTHGDIYNETDIITKIGLPCMVKPNRAGSSFGISKINNVADLGKGIKEAFSFDNQIMIEEFIEGTEVTVGIIPYKGELKILPITEIVSYGDFFDYKAKYEGNSEEITPARISDKDKIIVEKVALNVYKSLNIKGFSRAEYIIKNGVPYFIEINTIPGLTEASILPQQAKSAGISLSKLFDSSIENI